MKLRHLSTACVFLSALIAAVAPAAGAPIFRWVDDQGTTHYSEVVPDRYRDRAKLVRGDSPPSAQEQERALARARALRARAATTASAPDKACAPGPAPAASGVRPKRPAQVPDERTPCETWQRLYAESLECFGPFRTARGGIKPEAFDVCNEVAEPPPARCRLRLP